MPVTVTPPSAKRLESGFQTRFPVFVTLALDPAVSDRKGADASGITVNGTDPSDNWWVFEADPFRGQPNAVVDRVVLYAVQYRPAIISIEKVAFSYLYSDLLIPRLSELGLSCQVVPYTEATRMSKHARISALQPRFRAGKIRIRAGLTALVEQLENYAGPDSLDHEDLIDSLAQHTPIARPADLLEMTTIAYPQEVPPSKRNDRLHQTGDRLDGTWTGR